MPSAATPQTAPLSLYIDNSIPYLLVCGGLFAYLRKRSVMSLVGASTTGLLWYLRHQHAGFGLLSGFLLLGMGASRYSKVQKKMMPIGFMTLGAYMMYRASGYLML